MALRAEKQLLGKYRLEMVMAPAEVDIALDLRMTMIMAFLLTSWVLIGFGVPTQMFMETRCSFPSLVVLVALPVVAAEAGPS